MKLNKLTIGDRELFNSFLRLRKHELSACAFDNIYIWKAMFDIYWAEAKNSLCVFFKDRAGCFMYLPLLGQRPDAGAVKEAFAVMDDFNGNKRVSRIENAEEADIPFYRGLGYDCAEKGREYVYRRADLAGLKGDMFKSKRASVNYFLKHYRFEYLPFSPEYKDGCLKLYEEWAKGRRAKHADYIYGIMLEDSYLCLKALLTSYDELNIKGKLALIGGEVKGFIFGFELSKEVFCVLYEVTDLAIKGVSQFIFQKFCADLADYSCINTMDDSGLKNLKKAKLSYHPARLAPAYIIRRKQPAAL